MKEHRSIFENQSMILTKMNEIYKYRRNLVDQRQTTTEILEEFPRLADYKYGALVCNNVNFIGKHLTIISCRSL